MPTNREVTLKDGTTLKGEAAQTYGRSEPLAPVVPESTSITTESSVSEPPMTIPNVPAATEAVGLEGELSTLTANTTNDLALKRSEAQKKSETSFEQYIKSLNDSEGKTQLESEAFGKKGGVDDIQKELDDINQQMLAEQEGLRKQIEAIETDGAGSFAGKQAGVAEARRVSLRKQADLAIVQLSRQGRFDSAKTVADRAVASEMEQDYRRTTILGKIYEDNKDLFTKAEQREFEVAQDIRKTADANKEYRLRAEYDQKLKQSDPSYQLGLQLTRAQISNTYSQISERNTAALAAKNAAAFVTPPIVNPTTGKPDPIGSLSSVIKATGGKDNVKLQDAAGVVAALQTFAERNLDGTFAGTGPFAGFNAAKSAEGKTNEADLQAIELKVQQWASGASLTESQTKMVANLTPKPGDFPGQIKAKTNGLTNFMLSQTRGTLAAQGINYQPGTVDFFDKKAPVNAFLDEAEKVLNSSSTIYSEAGYSL